MCSPACYFIKLFKLQRLLFLLSFCMWAPTATTLSSTLFMHVVYLSESDDDAFFKIFCPFPHIFTVETLKLLIHLMHCLRQIRSRKKDAAKLSKKHITQITSFSFLIPSFFFSGVGVKRELNY